MKITVRNGQNDLTQQAELADDVTLAELAEALEEDGTISLPNDSTTGYQYMNKRTQEELPGNTRVDELDIQEGDVISIYSGTVVA